MSAAQKNEPRDDNYSLFEREAIRTAVRPYSDIVEGTSKTAHANKRKDQAWDEIAVQVDAVCFVCLFVRGLKSLLIHNSVFSETNLHFIVFFN